MSVEKMRLSGGKLVFLNVVYVIVGIVLFRVVDPFSWYSPDSPEEVAEVFLESIENGDFEEAKKYATDDTQDELDMLEMATEDNQQYRTVHIVSSSDFEDYAIISYQLGQDPEIHSLHLKKEWNGEWKAETTKSAMQERDNASDEENWLEVEDPAPVEVELPEVSIEESLEEASENIDEAMEEIEVIEGVNQEAFEATQLLLKKMNRLVDSLEMEQKKLER